jgi:GT2 family glycosyltransferase
VILTHGTEDLHVQLLRDLEACGLVTDIIVVHNPRDSDEADPPTPAGARLLRQDRNRGYAGGMNAGIERALAAEADAVLLLTHDALMRSEAIEELAAKLSEHGAGIIGPALHAPGTSRLWSVGKRDTWAYATEHVKSADASQPVVRRTSIDGSVMLISRAVAEEVRFDESYFMYYDESEYCRQARARGHSVLVATRAHASSVPGGQSRPRTHAYLMARNRLLYARRHGRLAAIRAGIGSLGAIARALPKPGGTRFADPRIRRQSMTSAWAMVRGIVDYVRRRTGPPPPALVARDLRDDA